MNQVQAIGLGTMDFARGKIAYTIYAL
ncbi:MAG: hypothetical protein ACLQU2_04675 [Candidatus Binataceae bacterium]